jgi:hypothetical protein
LLLAGYCWRQYHAARWRAWSFGPGWPSFAPLWLSLVVKDRFIKRARWALPAHVMFYCSPSRTKAARMLQTARLSYFEIT